MSTQFETGFEDGDIIEADHVKQFAEPINELESGAAIFRVATNDSGAYSVDFRTSANSNGHSINSLTQGQVIVFKASHDSPASAALKVLRNDSPGYETHPLFLGDAQVGADDILQDQMVVVVFNNTIVSRFDVVGIASSDSLDDLSDVAISSPATGQVLRFNGANFVNAALSAADIGAGTVSNTELGYLDGVTSAIQTQLDGKQEQDDALDEISSLTLTKGDILVHDGTEINKLDVGTSGQVLSVDSSAATGLKWVSGGGGGASDLDDLSDVAISSPTSGQVLRHNGTNFVNAALSAADIGTGSVSNTEFGYLDGVTSAIQTQLDDKESLSAKGVANGYASLDSSGKVPTSQLPSSGGGASNLDDLTDVAITSPTTGQVLRHNGTVFVNADVQIGDVSGLQDELDDKQGVLSGTADVPGLDTALSGKASTSHTHSASDITSGTLGLARGGTGADFSATGGAGQVLKQTSSGANVSVAALSISDLPTGISAANIGSGSVSNAEFGYLDGVTSAIQTQLDAKLSGTVPVASGGTGATSAGAARTNLGAQAQSSALDAIAGLSMAKGDILVHNGTQLTKMSPGTNGQLLSADSTQTTGLGWVTGSGGGGSPTGTANKVAYFNSSGALASTANLSFNASNTQMGVGPTTPGSTLHVSSAATGAVDGTTGIVVSRNTSYVSMEAGLSDDSYVGTTGSGAFSLRTSNTPRITLNSSGKCTLFPEIVGGQQLRLSGYSSGATNGTKGIQLEVSGGTEQVRMEVGTSNDSYVGTVGGSSFHLRTSNTARFSLNSSGYCTLFPRIVGGQQLKLTGYANGAVDGSKGIELEIPGWDSVKMEVGASNDSYLGTMGSSSFSLRTNNTPRFTLNSSGYCTLFPRIVGGQQLKLTGYANGAVNGSKGIELEIPGWDSVKMEVGASNDSYVGTIGGSSFSLRTLDTPRFTINSSGKCTLFPGLSGQKLGLDFASSAVNGSKGIEIVNGGHYVRMEAGNSDDSYVGTATSSDFHLRRNDVSLVALRSGRVELLNNIGLRFNEATSNGSNYVELKSPASLVGNVSLTLPATAGTSNQYLKTDGSGNLSWGTGPAGSGATNALAFWSSADTVSYASGFSRSGSELVAPTLTTSLGQVFSNESYVGLFANSGGALRADFQSSKTYIPAVRNYGAGQLMYWNSDGELLFQYSRGAHKEDIQPIELSMDDLMKWRPVEFKWKDNFGGNQDIGFIAEEVAAVCPRAATYDQPWDYTNEKTGEYAVDESGMPKRLEGEQVAAGVKYEKAWIPMLAAVQSFYRRYQDDSVKHQGDMAKLEKRLAALEGARN